MFYDLDTNSNPSSNELKSHMDFIIIIIMLQQSDKGFGSGKKHVFDICTKSYVNGLRSAIRHYTVNQRLQ